jgi:hypothetical protein
VSILIDRIKIDSAAQKYSIQILFEHIVGCCLRSVAVKFYHVGYALSG